MEFQGMAVHEDDRATSCEVGKWLGIELGRFGQLLRRRVERPGEEPEILIRGIPAVQGGIE
jgi:hypothetical protein